MLIKEYYGEKYLNELQFVLSRIWIGKLEEQNSIAYNLNHIFNVNLNRDSGFNKKWIDKIKDKFYEIPGTLLGEILKVILTAIIVYFLIKLGIIIKD